MSNPMSTARMLIIYGQPAAPQIFDSHYFAVHVPLAKKLRGLRKYEVSRGGIVPMNAASKSYLIATLHFDDVTSIRAALATEAGRACAADRRLLAGDADVQTFLFESREV